AVLDAAAARLADEPDGLFDRQRIQSYEHGVSAGGSPRRSLIEQLVARESDYQRPTRSATCGAQALDKVQHRCLERVRVLEQRHYRVVASEPVDQRDEACLYVMHKRRLFGAVGQTEEQRQTLHDPFALGWMTAEIDKLAQAALDLVRRLPGVDAGEVAHDRGDRGERGGVGVRPGPAAD